MLVSHSEDQVGSAQLSVSRSWCPTWVPPGEKPPCVVRNASPAWFIVTRFVAWHVVGARSVLNDWMKVWPSLEPACSWSLQGNRIAPLQPGPQAPELLVMFLAHSYLDTWGLSRWLTSRTESDSALFWKPFTPSSCPNTLFYRPIDFLPLLVCNH